MRYSTRRIIGLCSLFWVLSCPWASATEPDLWILTSEEPPTNYMDGKTLTGITTDVIRDLQQRLGDQTPIELQPWSRVLKTAQMRPNTLIYTLGKTPERVEHGLSFIGPITTRRHMVFKRADSHLNVDGVDDIKRQNLLVGGLREDWRVKWLASRGVRVDEANTHEMTLHLLMLNRVQLITLSDLELKVDAGLAGVSQDAIKPAFVISEAPAYIAFSKGTSPALIAKWQGAFAAFQASDVPARLAKKWGALLGEPMDFTPERGFSLQTPVAAQY
ncbi:MAG: transporter substrate-binding domain-containing protein [Burkholderiales bacterium]|nr:transporter substrate-binding domain-containing protein [Burkholderiales bacterium]